MKFQKLAKDRSRLVRVFLISVLVTQRQRKTLNGASSPSASFYGLGTPPILVRLFCLVTDAKADPFAVAKGAFLKDKLKARQSRAKLV